MTKTLRILWTLIKQDQEARREGASRSDRIADAWGSWAMLTRKW